MSFHLNHIATILAGAAVMRERLERHREEVALLHQVRQQLPEAMREHVIDVRLVGQVLVLALTSAVWTTRVRFLAPDILAAVTTPPGQPPPTMLRPRVCPDRLMPPDTSKRQQRQPVPRLSPAAAAHLLEAAETMTDAGLARIFRRLACRHATSDDPMNGCGDQATASGDP